MKRALLIAGGTVTGLGAVLSITPPQLGTVQSSGGTGLGLTPASTTGGTAPSAATNNGGTTSNGAASKSPAPATSQSSTATKKANATATKSAAATSTQSAAPSATATSTHSASPTPAATHATSGVSGTFTGDPYAAAQYGTLIAHVTLTDGKISNVTATQSPSSWSQNILPTLIPYVNAQKITVEQIKQYSADQLPCATSNRCGSRATYTSEAFWASIKSALAKAKI
jgi:uncharacterized protein with FMN-binding domain